MAKKSKSKEIEEDKGSSPPADIFKLLFGKDAPEEPGLAGLGLLPNPTNSDNIDDYNSNKNTNKRDKEEKSQLDEEKKKKKKQKEEEVNPNLDVAKKDVKKKKKEERREIETDVNEGEDGIGDLKKEKKKRKKEEEVNPNLDVAKSDVKKKRKEERREIGVDVNEGEDGIGDLKKEKNKKKKKEEEEVNVNVLKKEEKGEAKIGDLSNKEKKKKRKRDEIEEEYEARKSGEVSKKVVGEKRKAVDDPAEMMVSKEGFDDESKLLRTIFVGNLPLKLKKKSLLKEFSKYGEVESIRIRSVPLLDSKTPRKGAILQGKINEAVDSVHAYIVFKDEKSAQASLSHNMEMVGGNHIRVDMACPPRKKLKGDSTTLYDHKRTIFVGNLPFDVKDEELYKLFCGINQLESSIEAVRTIRDPNTSMGKGIAYVLFKTKFEFQYAEGQMFVLSLIEHTLRLPPHLLGLPLDQAIKGELESLFLDKVIPKLGLCISVYDIRSIDGGFIYAGDGASTYTVKFRLIMFRPFVGEIISGKVESLDANGLRVSLGFFNDILVSADRMPDPSTFNEREARWIWTYNDLELAIEKDAEIRFRVQSIGYPPIPIEAEKDAKPFAPMVVTASLDFDGLGPIAWWV